MMKTLKYADWNVVNDLATKQVGKFSVYISNGLTFDSEDSDDFDEDEIIWKFVHDGIDKMFGSLTAEFYSYMGNVLCGGLFFFESEAEAWEFYKIFDQNNVNSSIYATLNCPVHGCITENT